MSEQEEKKRCGTCKYYCPSPLWAGEGGCSNKEIENNPDVDDAHMKARWPGCEYHEERETETQLAKE